MATWSDNILTGKHFGAEGNREKLLDAMDRGLIDERQYKLMSGYDARKEMGMTPIQTLQSSGIYNTAKGVMSPQDFEGKIGPIKSTLLNTMGSMGRGFNKDQYSGILGLSPESLSKNPYGRGLGLDSQSLQQLGMAPASDFDLPSGERVTTPRKTESVTRIPHSPFTEGARTIAGKAGEELVSPRKTGWRENLRQTYLPQDETGLDEMQLAKNLGGQFLTNLVTNKAVSGIMGTGALSFLGPLAPFAAMYLAKRGVNKGKGYLRQGFQPPGTPRAPGKVWGPMSYLQPKQDRTFRDKDFGVGSSGNVSMAGVLYDKQHGAGAYKDKTIRNRISKIVESGSTSDIAIDKINKLAKDLDLEHEGAISTTPIMSNMGEIAAEARETEARAAAAKAAAAAAAAKRAVDRHRGQDAGGGGQAAGDRAGGAGLSSPFSIGGSVRIPVTNIDRPLTGRSRDI